MPTTTWTQESTTSPGWTSSGGTNITTSTSTSYNDNDVLTFGSDQDYGISFNATNDRLEFLNPDNTMIANLQTTGLYLEQINFIELSSLPGTAVEGRMIYVNNEYYLGVGS